MTVRQNRLLNSREYINKKRCEECELARQSRRDCANMFQKRKQSVETHLERENWLKKGFIEEVQVVKMII